MHMIFSILPFNGNIRMLRGPIVIKKEPNLCAGVRGVLREKIMSFGETFVKELFLLDTSMFCCGFLFV